MSLRQFCFWLLSQLKKKTENKAKRSKKREVSLNGMIDKKQNRIYNNKNNIFGDFMKPLKRVM